MDLMDHTNQFCNCSISRKYSVYYFFCSQNNPQVHGHCTVLIGNNIGKMKLASEIFVNLSENVGKTGCLYSKI